MTSRDPLSSLDRSSGPTAADRRRNPRRATPAEVSIDFEGSSLQGAGRNISDSGLYFVTSDELKVHVTIEHNGQKTQVPARLVRIDDVTPSTWGVALKFDQSLDPRNFDRDS